LLEAKTLPWVFWVYGNDLAKDLCIITLMMHMMMTLNRAFIGALCMLPFTYDYSTPNAGFSVHYGFQGLPPQQGRRERRTITARSIIVQHTSFEVHPGRSLNDRSSLLN